MSKRVQAEVGALLARAESDGLCLTASSESMRRLLNRWVQQGRLVRPFPGLYSRTCYWNDLSPIARSLCKMRTLSHLHPDWVFCGESAAAVHGLWISNHRISTLCIAASEACHGIDNRYIRRRFVKPEGVCLVAGVRVTPLVQTSFDCVRSLPFREGLAIADSTLRIMHETSEGLLELFDQRYHGQRGFAHAMATTRHASGLSESGGESIARATMIEQGFQLPRLQVEIIDPLDSSATYRVDFLWELENGQIVIGEFDGREKYRNPIMTGGRDAVDVLADERLRESRLGATGARVVRFSFADVRNVSCFVRLLEAYGIPRTLPSRSRRRGGASRRSGPMLT